MVERGWPRAVFLFLVIRILLSLNRAKAFKTQVLLRVSLLLVLWLDVYTHAPNLNPTVNRSVYAPGLIREEMHLPLEARFGEPRFMETLSAMDKVHYTSLIQPADDYLCRRLALFDNCNLLDDTPKIDGFYSLYLRETEQVIATLYGYDGHNIDLRGLKDFLGVGYINAPDTSREKALEWIPRDSHLPLVTAGQRPIFAADSNIISGLVQTNFDPRQGGFSSCRSPDVYHRQSHHTRKIVSQSIEAQQLQLRVIADASAMVVIAQSFYHPWQAFVDGNPSAKHFGPRTTLFRHVARFPQARMK